MNCVPWVVLQSPADLADAGSMTFHRLLESAQHQAADSACDQAS